MKKPKLFFLGLSFLISLATQAQILVNSNDLADILRVNIGVFDWRLNQIDSSARIGRGIHLSNEVRIVSSKIKKESNFTAYDAFYFDINLGKMTSEKHKRNEEFEKGYSAGFNFGYLLALGFKNDKFSVLGGMDFRCTRGSVGGTTMPDEVINFYKPIVLRGDFAFRKGNPDQRMALMLWSTPNINKIGIYRSLRYEFSFENTGRWWLFFQYNYQKNYMQDYFRGNPYAVGVFNQLFFGIRKGISP